MSTALNYIYRYPFNSRLESVSDKPSLSLSTSDAKQKHPYFFDGKVRQPRVLGDMLLVLTDVVRTHFFLPKPAILDPVLTSNENMLRLEGFSGCCGVYARADFSDEFFDSEINGRGTTNVDFNASMRTALSRLGDSEEVNFAVGADEVVLSRESEQVVEKKVKLPIRWIKGFSEVQSYQPGLKLQMEITAAEALRFFRSLPKSGAPKQPSYVVSSGKSIRLSQRKVKGALKINGTHRIRILEPLMKKATQLRIWYDDNSEVSGWEVIFEKARFFLMISPELFRGFSGEGQNLIKLASNDWQDTLSQVRAQLTWQNQIPIDTIATNLGLPVETITNSLAALGARGLAGYDVHSGEYFHRELPFDLEQIEDMQPRLKGARKLVNEQAVKSLGTDENNRLQFQVKGTGINHMVSLDESDDYCTCPWHSKYLGKRGPCKHILAVQISLSEPGLE